jgi:molybdopterin synthase sulfur carrier subunit
MINILFFARFREHLGVAHLSLPFAAGTTVAVLKQQLIEKQGDSWADVLNATNVVKAVNQQVVDDLHILEEGDEVAFFPPVTGG